MGVHAFLRGQALDTRGEPLPAHQLAWSSTGAGIVGSGFEGSLSLDEGEHTVALMVVDGQAIVALELVEITVSDEAGEISMDSALIPAAEDTQATITVSRSGGSAGVAAVRFYTTDGTAISGGDSGLGENDFQAIANDGSSWLEWADGEAGTRTITIYVNDDKAVEGDEELTVHIEAASGENLGISSTTVLIPANGTHLIFSNGFEDESP